MKPLVLKSTQIFIFAAILLLMLFITLLCIGFLMRYEVDNDVSSLRSVAFWNDKLSQEQQIWFDKAIEELKVALNLRQNRRQAKNVIVFTVTGIDAEVLAAARWASNATAMSWDSFAHLGMLKHRCSSMQHCDALSLATALFGGVKTTFKLGGLDAAVPLRSCSAAKNATHHIKSIVHLAQQAGKRTGFVTTGRVTAPLNAALYAHVADSNWECDATMALSKQNEGCRDIARELMETQTGRNLNVIMGGGRQALVANILPKKLDPFDEMACNSRDRRNLIRDWQKQKLADKQRFKVLQKMQDLGSLNGSSVDYVLGIFANGNLEPEYNNMPTLRQMVSKAIDVLNSTEGYLLVVNAIGAVQNTHEKQLEMLQNLNEAIQESLRLVNTELDNTLMVLLFNNGVLRDFSNNTSNTWMKQINTERLLQTNESYYNVMESVIADTVVYANGPKAYLLQGMHDETFLAHVIRYALPML